MFRMAGNRSTTTNQLQDAIAHLIRNQAAFVEQIARSDQERLALQRQNAEQQLETKQRETHTDERWRQTQEWQQKSDEQFMRFEKRLIGFEERLKRIETTLLQLPQVLKKEIGIKT
jgi:hypothetical protein